MPAATGIGLVDAATRQAILDLQRRLRDIELTVGPQGVAGATWRSGSGVPSDSLGVDGDFYLDSPAGDVYLRAAGVYTVVANISGPSGDLGAVGPTGPRGPSGSSGNKILSGAGVPSNGLGANGDFYINTLTADFYGPKVGGVWGAPSMNLWMCNRNVFVAEAVLVDYATESDSTPTVTIV